MRERASSDNAAALRLVTLEAPDPDAAQALHKAVPGSDLPVHVRAGDTPTSGFHGYTLSLVVARPGMVDTLALLGRKALAKDAGVDIEGTGSSRTVLGGDTDPFTDPDGFPWETSS